MRSPTAPRSTTALGEELCLIPRAGDRGCGSGRGRGRRRFAARVGRLALFVALTGIATSGLLGTGPLSTGPEALAQPAVDAGDARARSEGGCTFATRDVTVARRDASTSRGTCTAVVAPSRVTDASRVATWLTIEGASVELRRVVVGLIFLGPPEGAIIHAPAHGPLPWIGQAEVTANDNAEWVGIVGVQGTFDLDLTTVRPVRIDGGGSYVLHGELEVELPGSNVRSAQTLHVSF
ncbi:MAG: hypothetical protein JST00_04040 [Deltaproteobacteria bacterium]|nr:hypothetical protein [Deltaproteobacteria bacterium]